MREISLSKGYSAVVDDDDYSAVVAAGRWSACVKPKHVYALRAVRRLDGGWTSIRLHNFITGWRFVDHVNGDGLDNQRANLRPAGQASNGWNVGLRAHNTSGYKGVTWHKECRKWMAQIVVNKRRIYLGLFDDLILAARIYDLAAIEHHGEFARLNFPLENSA